MLDVRQSRFLPASDIRHPASVFSLLVQTLHHVQFVFFAGFDFVMHFVHQRFHQAHSESAGFSFVYEAFEFLRLHRGWIKAASRIFDVDAQFLFIERCAHDYFLCCIVAVSVLYDVGAGFVNRKFEFGDIGAIETRLRADGADELAYQCEIFR